MATYNLRRFDHVGGLKAIALGHLLALLNPYRTYFDGRGLMLPQPTASDGLDYDELLNILMNPVTDTPNGLIDALFFVHEMSTPEAMDDLIQEAKNNNISLDGNPDPTAADVAVQVYLQDKELLERKHAEQYLKKPRSFEYFQTDSTTIPEFKQPTAKTLAALERDLDDWFEEKKRGRGSRVFVYPKTGEVWILVRHGDPYRREGSLDGGKASSVFYRPEKYDVLVYDPGIGEIRMHACGKGEKDLFQRKFGRHVFNDENFFPGTGKYTLEPIRTDGDASMVCTDVEGMDWVRLKELQFFWGGTEKEIEIRKANDVFAAYAERDYAMPQKARIIRAGFQVKFTDSKTTRMVTIRPSNIALYTRDSDASVIEDWLDKRGFIIPGQRDDNEETERLLAHA
ncbi:MAG: hypothetical protein KJ970_18115 [Candidatus Eisenbacteria bacterium]|uniref:Uncharacterized protein n=1 Tax=Eiseniibacteriota bacterium TaxID=2212470 RepID=A0A948RXH2_UNCEI|nr:hypothetical protein [Candidatus Eisenbacteria bacterium]MBU2692838.1 hypothetical protein [Candidatus Eisenbacteria bacterium]